MAETILIAEDDVELGATIRETLTSKGYDCVAYADPRDALQEIEEREVALLLTDMKMPHMSGIELARRALEIYPDIRIILITAFSTIGSVIDSLRMGIDNYLPKPFHADELIFNIERSLECRRLVFENRSYQDNLEAMVEDQTAELRERHQKLSRSQMDSIFAIGNIIEARDAYTRGHTERVTYFAVALAEKMGWQEERIRELGIGSPLHDIGKIGVPDSILNKSSQLNFREFEVMKRHPEIGYKMLRGSGFSSSAIACILYHHERFDGEGYPFGLAGTDIPEEGRLMAICDAFDAMTSDRIYRPAMPLKKAAEIVRNEAGSHFDPEMSEAFLKLVNQGAFDMVLEEHEVKGEFEKLIRRLTAV